MAGYFEGWYVKQQTEHTALAFIPSLHRADDGQKNASLQVVWPGGSYAVSCPKGRIDAHRDALQIGESRFTRAGCRLCVCSPDFTLTGQLAFSHIAAPKYDIMGPFRFLPRMQCRHTIFSLCHRVSGEVTLNGRTLRFHDAPGYMEGDRGVSFPRRYLWSQCCFDGGSVVLSVADIPYLGLSFTGCIASVFLDGREYRLATYLGARAEAVDARAAVICQGRLRLSCRLLHGQETPLQAPQRGIMARTIHESLACRVCYRLTDADHELLSFSSDQASFESVWN